MTKVLALASTLVVVALLGAGGSSAAFTQTTTIFGTVGPEFTIILRDASGARVTHLDPGAYAVEVEDLSDFHNFRLRGPGVNEATAVESTGTVTWNVTFTDGVYSYNCDPHASSMRGTFTVGNPPQATPTPPTGSGSRPITAKTRLVLTSGPDLVITLKTKAGKRVRSMKRGTYTVLVRDRGANHNAHVIAPGYNRKTSPLSYVGTQTWKVRLKKIGTLRFLCDPHRFVGMRGSAKIIR